jgi:hypothetical protein
MQRTDVPQNPPEQTGIFAAMRHLNSSAGEAFKVALEARKSTNCRTDNFAIFFRGHKLLGGLGRRPAL